MITETVIVTVIIGLVQMFKGAGVPSNFAPLIAVLLGIFASFTFNGLGAESIVTGIIYGLTSAGLYSGIKVNLPK